MKKEGCTFMLEQVLYKRMRGTGCESASFMTSLRHAKNAATHKSGEDNLTSLCFISIPGQNTV